MCLLRLCMNAQRTVVCNVCGPIRDGWKLPGNDARSIDALKCLMNHFTPTASSSPVEQCVYTNT